MKKGTMSTITGSPWWSLKTAWRHRKKESNDQLGGWEHKQCAPRKAISFDELFGVDADGWHR